MTQLIKKFSVIIILFLLPFSIYAQTESHQLSTHILDISKGEPAQGVDITLYKLNPSTPSQWKQIAIGKTDVNGRISNFLPSIEDNTGIYMLKFYTEPYFLKQGLNQSIRLSKLYLELKAKSIIIFPLLCQPTGILHTEGINIFLITIYKVRQPYEAALLVIFHFCSSTLYITLCIH